MPRRFALIRCRLLALLLGAAAALAAAAAPIQVVEAPRGLAWSSLDVATATQWLQTQREPQGDALDASPTPAPAASPASSAATTPL